jgi:hypothetical protein
MGVRRVAVIASDGTKLNTILVDERAMGKYTPGYGAYLVDEGPDETPPASDKQLTLDKTGLQVLDILIDGKKPALNTGDKLDLGVIDAARGKK